MNSGDQVQKSLAAVTTMSIYNGCSTWKDFWEENFTVGEFSAVHMKNCGRRNVRKHREIMDSDKYVTSDISLKLDSMDKKRITSSESKNNLGIPGKGLITSLVIKANASPNNYKKGKVCH